MTDLDRRILLAGLVVSTASCAGWAAAPEGSEVMVIASMHRRMETSPTFTYADLYEIVARFRPDRVGVEIRQEDLGRSDEYLAGNYPPEMIHLARSYGDRSFGFDWLGRDLAGRPIPADWWKTGSPIKRLEREMDAPALARRLARDDLARRLDALSEQQEAILLAATPGSLADGRYDRITADYYRTVGRLTEGTRFAALWRFYRRRDAAIAGNVVRAVAARPGRRFAIVTGADHHGPVVAALRASGPGVRLVPVG